MKHLLTLLLAASSAFSVPQTSATVPDSIKPLISISNRVTASTSAKTFRLQIDSGRRLVGANVTNSGAAPFDPKAAAVYCKTLGLNWIRFHEDDRGPESGWWTDDSEYEFITALQLEGIRVSVNGAGKTGELYPGGMDRFWIDLMDQNKAAEDRWLMNLERRKKIFQHPGVFMVCLTNEVAHLTTPEKAKRFWLKWSPWFRAVNPNLLLTDSPDAWDQAEHPSPWADVTALYDVIVPHFYGGGEDYGVHGGGTWIGEGWKLWKLRLFIGRTRELAGKKLPVLIQEFGSFNVNKHYAQNEMFLQVMAALEGWSTCMFALVTNQDAWIGKSVDKYAAATDRLRLNMLQLGAYLSKNAAGLKLEHWDGTLGKWGPNFRVSGDKVELTQDYARIGSYLFTWNPQMRWVWLVKPL